MTRGTRGQLYEAGDGFRWHLKSGNNRIVAESGEAYDEERKAHAAFEKVFAGTYPLFSVAGEELAAPEGSQPQEPVTAGAGLSELPDDRKHPLFSPLTVDGNKPR